MLIAEPRALIEKLNATCRRAMEAGASLCVTSRHYEVTVEHVLLALVDDRESDVAVLFDRTNIGPFRKSLQRSIEDQRTGNSGKPVFSPMLFEWVQDAWIYASTELGDTKLRSGALFVRLVQAPTRYLSFTPPGIEDMPRDELRKNLAVMAGSSAEAVAVAAERAAGGKSAAPAEGGKSAGDGALARYTTDLVALAKEGKIDPVVGREAEIRQVVDILVRRRKNNPIIVGDAGVGKTALVEGLALRIAEGTVPEQLAKVRVLSLDMGALQAGAGVKGEFEARLKGVISEVKSASYPIVMFIDEAHTLIGGGGAQGGGDAANLLKPALARGELRTIAATTWAEYKKYIEKDAALERRFQPVKVDEPSIETAILMMRGLARKFEEAHGVVISDEAVRAAVTLSSRYISGRQLPDKSVDLLDTSAARVKVSLAAPPAVLEDARALLAGVTRELEAFDRDFKAGLSIDDEAHAAAKAKREELTTEIAEIEGRLKDQRAIVAEVQRLRGLVAAGDESMREALKGEIDKLRAIPADKALVHAHVSEALVASVVGDWTGIPVGKMVKDDVAAVLALEENLKKRVRGQDQGLALMARELRSARSGLKPPQVPLGVFLLAGPSGVGKTETALALADLVFGGERFMVTINMSEFQERHTVSKLVGSPPGYVGYGEGGVLTEAVRQRPYSVVLLDEVEKADKDVMNLFYQVFDKGMLADGEGRIIDFKNTVIILTSNLGTDALTAAALPGAPQPPIEELTALIKPTLTAHFKPALLARMTVVPYIPISTDALLSIARMKLGAVVKRAMDTHGVALQIDDGVFNAVADRCKEVQSGARNIDHILRGTIMPLVSNELLGAMADGVDLKALRLSVAEDGGIVCTRASA